MGKIMGRAKWMAVICVMAAFVCLGVVDVRAEDTEIDTSVFKYRENEDGTIFISEYDGTDETVIIPAEIDGKTVTGIGLGSFSQCETVKHLIISEGIMDILDNGFDGTFYSCENLETVSLPSTLKTVGGWAFMACHKLREINLPEGLVSIGDYAFFKCYKLSNISLPESLTTIGEAAFCQCGSLEKLIIPDNVTQIGEDAFNLSYDERIPIYGNPDAYIKTYCDADYKIKFRCINHSHIVTDAEIPATCTKDGYTAANRCADCGTILSGHKIIPAGHDCEWKITREATVREKGLKEYVCIKCGKVRDVEWIPRVTVPKKNEIISDLKDDSYKVTKTGTQNGAVEFFSSNSFNSSITIPNTVKIAGITYKVTSIAKNAFKNNKSLKKITINRNVTEINANAFSGCANLKTITIKSKNLTSVGKNALKGIHPKAKIKVPPNKLDQYKKLLAKKGQKPSVKITK